jgi:hypothetical protein
MDGYLNAIPDSVTKKSLREPFLEIKVEDITPGSAGLLAPARGTDCSQYW